MWGGLLLLIAASVVASSPMSSSEESNPISIDPFQAIKLAKLRGSSGDITAGSGASSGVASVKRRLSEVQRDNFFNQAGLPRTQPWANAKRELKATQAKTGGAADKQSAAPGAKLAQVKKQMASVEAKKISIESMQAGLRGVGKIKGTTTAQKAALAQKEGLGATQKRRLAEQQAPDKNAAPPSKLR